MDADKGLRNFAGENNCFLNVVIQSLWHLDAFRSRFARWNEHSHEGLQIKSQTDTYCTCPHCALKLIFTHYEYSDERVIPPNALRLAMHKLYETEGRFKIGDIDDAAELLEALMETLHMLHNKEDPIKKERRREEDCVAHAVFGLEKLEQIVCDLCGVCSEPHLAHQFIHYSYVRAILDLANKNPTFTFEKLLRLSQLEEKRSCPSGDLNPKPKVPCPQKCGVKQYLLNVPQVFALGLVWETPDPPVNEIKSLFRLLRDSLSLRECFGMDNALGPLKFRMRGMICYYGKHYICYFKSHLTGKWMTFDDGLFKITDKGDWLDVMNRCLAGHFHPSVIFYERIPENNYTINAAASNGSQMPEWTKNIANSKSAIPITNVANNPCSNLTPAIVLRPQTMINNAGFHEVPGYYQVVKNSGASNNGSSQQTYFVASQSFPIKIPIVKGKPPVYKRPSSTKHPPNATFPSDPASIYPKLNGVSYVKS